MSDDYIPPSSLNLVFEFDDDVYTPPSALNLVFEFSDGELTPITYVQGLGFDSFTIGTTQVKSSTHSIRPNGIISKLTFGQHNIFLTSQGTEVTGFSSQSIGQPSVKNKNTHAYPLALDAFRSGQSTIYNLKRFVALNNYGINSAIFSVAYVQGGVKNVNVVGFNNTIFGQSKIHKNEQYVDLRSPSQGIAPPTIDQPSVSPRILYLMGILPGAFGTAIVQRNPSPKGFTTDFYGIAWVSHSPRYLTPAKVNSFQPGYPKIFDPTQRIYHEGSPKIPAGIFGDIAIRNARRLIKVPGFDLSFYGDWSNVFSNLISVEAKSFDAAIFGGNTIRNKTPSVIPGAWNSNSFGQSLISERIRHLNARGFGFGESERFGKHILTKPPEIKPFGLGAMALGQAFISNKVRTVFAGANDYSAMGGEIVVWFRYRHIQSKGIDSQIVANPKIEHGIRNLLAKGSDFTALGSTTIGFKKRIINTPGIYENFSSSHRIGGTQLIQPPGFIASKFGLRIVPENQVIYGLGFNAQAFSETHHIELYKRWVRPLGFFSFGQQSSDRYGTAKLWNKRQYIQHQYDSGDGLNPPSFGQWTAILNRNRAMKVLSFDASRHGYSVISNKATPLLVMGFDALKPSRAMISHRIRSIRPDAIQEPHITSWGRVFNTAFVISPKGSKYDAWGEPKAINTRREYRWVGAFESMLFGQAMVAFKIRKLDIESRYGIAPPLIPLPKVHLYTRYIDPQGLDYVAFGGPSLHIKWNIITPRWTYRELIGNPAVRNRTPELRHKGIANDIFGKTSIHLYRRDLHLDGYKSELIGKLNIAYRDRYFTVNGFNTMGIGLHRVTKTGAPPYSLQTITLDWDGEGVRPEDFQGNGITPPVLQLPKPEVRTNVIFANGFSASQIGSPHAQSNGILLEVGIQELLFGDHFIGLKNRTIKVPTLGDFGEIEKTMPRVSPHTIYAVTEAPMQAIQNHPKWRLHFVNSDGGERAPGEVFGQVSISNRYRRISPIGFTQVEPVSRPRVDLRKRYIKPNSINSFRMGWHTFFDGSPQEILLEDEGVMSLYGQHTVTSINRGPHHIKPNGMQGTAFDRSTIEFLHRIVKPSGYQATLMGSQFPGDTPYKPKGLWVGKPMPTIPEGFNAEVFGNTFISLRVRDVTVEGFDSFVSEMDISNFKGRMKVTLVKKPVVIEPKEIKPEAFGLTTYGTPDIRLKTHYIRPDGNSDQYRKGGPK